MENGKSQTSSGREGKGLRFESKYPPFPLVGRNYFL